MAKPSWLLYVTLADFASLLGWCTTLTTPTFYWIGESTVVCNTKHSAPVSEPGQGEAIEPGF